MNSLNRLRQLLMPGVVIMGATGILLIAWAAVPPEETSQSALEISWSDYDHVSDMLYLHPEVVGSSVRLAMDDGMIDETEYKALRRTFDTARRAHEKMEITRLLEESTP